MYQAEYTNWAKEFWNNRTFINLSVVKGERAIISCLRAESALIDTLEWGTSCWQRVIPEVIADDKVPGIRWITYRAFKPSLVKIHQGERTIRMLVVPNTPAVLDGQGNVQVPQLERAYKLTERIKHLAYCGKNQAEKLIKLAAGRQILPIVEFAAYLLDRYASTEAATAAVEKLWCSTPQEICSNIPTRFHVLATTNMHSNRIKIKRCIEYMASWRL